MKIFTRSLTLLAGLLVSHTGLASPNLVGPITLILNNDSCDSPSEVEYQETPFWQDEFSGFNIDESKWDIFEGDTGPNHDHIASKDNVKLNGFGQLALITSRVGTEYHTGRISTFGKQHFSHGRFETRVKFQREQGFWTAFWMKPVGKTYDADISEIDIFEYLARPGPRLDTVQHTLHSLPFDWFDVHLEKVDNLYLGNKFHTIALEWTPTEYRFYIDGEETWCVSDAVAQSTQFGIIISTQLRIPEPPETSNWAGDITMANLPDQMLFDYVRVYKPKE